MEIKIPENDPVRLASVQLEELDYRKLYHAYSFIGRKSAAEPRIIFEVLVYGYMCGIYSTRKLDEACRKRVDFMWLLQGEPVPDYSTFARFRSGVLIFEEIENITLQLEKEYVSEYGGQQFRERIYACVDLKNEVLKAIQAK